MSEKIPMMVKSWAFGKYIVYVDGKHIGLPSSIGTLCGAGRFSLTNAYIPAVEAPTAHAACDLICPECLKKWREM